MILILQTHLNLLKTRLLKIQPKIRQHPANVTVPISKTLEDAAERMARVRRGKEIVIETVNVLQVFNAVTITAGEIFHRLEQNGEEDMTVVSVLLKPNIEHHINIFNHLRYVVIVTNINICV